MSKRPYAVLLVAMQAALLLFFSNKPEAYEGVRESPMSMPKHVPGEVLVKFRGGSETTLSKEEDDRPEHYVSKLPRGARLALHRVQKRTLKVFPKINLAHVQVASHLSIEEAMDELELSGEVEYVEPNYLLRAFAVPNDPRFYRQWALLNNGQTGGTPGCDIGAASTWDSETDGSQTVVAVIDTGVDYKHKDLAGNMWKNPKEIAGNRKDDDGNGYVDDIYGIDACNMDSNPKDDNGHGTHVAGIIGARGNNNLGVCGVNYKASIMALKFMDKRGWGSTADAIECIRYALAVKRTNGYPRMIMNNSWGGGGFSQSLYDAVRAAQDAGVLFVVAAGNESVNLDLTPTYPANYSLDNIINVGSSDHNDIPASYSNYGQMTVHLFAPGVSILSTLPRNRYGFMSGTSMASPYVAGAAALLWGKKPDATWSQIKSMLLDQVDMKGTFSDKCLTGGRLNLYNSLYANMN